MDLVRKDAFGISKSRHTVRLVLKEARDQLATQGYSQTKKKAKKRKR